MELRREIPEPAVAAPKLKEGLADCALFIASAPSQAFARASASALRRSASARTGLRMHPMKAVSFVFLTVIPNACFYYQLAQSLVESL